MGFKQEIDLRSDTVTRPGKGMLEAMMSAKVGDDVFGEDPTIALLEEKVSSRFGKESGLFCPTGTMCNQIAIHVHCQPGDEILCDATSHIYNYESGGAAFNSRVQVKIINGPGGQMSASQILENLNDTQDWLARTCMVAVENTANRAGGSIYSIQQLKEIELVCKKNALKFHMDGARVFNALAESGDDPEKIGKLFDSVSVCFSKGLGAPVGSILLGSRDFIRQARRVRKVLGGGMRQAGILAAACIYALDHHLPLLKEDHRKAKIIGEKLKSLAIVEEVLPVYTNIIIFKLGAGKNAADFAKLLATKNIKASAFRGQIMRFVTHLDFNNEMLDYVLDQLNYTAS